MNEQKLPAAPAIRMLGECPVEFTGHPYVYKENGGTAVSARELGAAEQAVVKIAVMEDDAANP